MYRPQSSFSRRVSPSKFVFMACVAFKVCIHGVCRLLSSFSWRVLPSKFVFMACVASNFVFMACVAFLVRFHGVCRLQLCVNGVRHLQSLYSWRLSPSKFVFMACPVQFCIHGVCRLLSLFSWRVSPSKFVFMACVAFKARFHGVVRLQSLY